jgi:threonine dehydratase
MAAIPRADAITAADVRAAAARIAGRVVATPCLHSQTLSALTGCDLWLKFENQQFTASFKERGALNRLLLLDETERARGVIAASAGNHAQGLARHATLLGIRSVIVMPEGSPFTKVRNTRALGAEVILEGEDFDAATAAMHRMADERGMIVVPAFDDAAIVAGQGTVALEMLAAVPELDVLVVPVGGGGLIAGMAVAAKDARPAIEVVGVQAALFPGMRDVLAGRVASGGGRTIAEGIAVREPGRITRALLAPLVDHIVTVDEAQLEHAVLLLVEIEKTVAEGAGAAALAAVLAEPERYRGRKVGLVISGGNLDTRLLASILLRGLVRDGRIVRVRTDVADIPGSLARVANAIAGAGGNVIEVQHQRLFGHAAAKFTEIDFTVETLDAAHAARLVAALKAAQIEAELVPGDVT